MSRKMGFQWRRNAKGPLPPSLPLSLPPPFLPTALSALFIYPSRQRRCHSSSSSSNRSGGNLSPVVEEADPPTGRLTMRRAGARQSLAIFQTSLGHSALRRPREGEEEGGGAEAERRSLHTTTTLHFVRFLSGERTSERPGRGRSVSGRGRSFVRWHFEFGRSHSLSSSVRPCCNISARVIAFAEDSR